jgi:hypothetical protein
MVKILVSLLILFYGISVGNAALTNFSAVRCTPKAGDTNSLVLRDSDGTNNFVVTAANGNTAVSGTLSVTGASTLTGNVTMSGTLSVAAITSSADMTVTGMTITEGVSPSATYVINGSTITPALLVHSSDTVSTPGNSYPGILLTKHSTGTTNITPNIVFVTAQGTVGAETNVASGQDLGSIKFGGWGDIEYSIAAEILVETDGTCAVNDMPGRIVFKVSADGAETPAEALRISNDLTAVFAGTVRDSNTEFGVSGSTAFFHRDLEVSGGIAYIDNIIAAGYIRAYSRTSVQIEAITPAVGDMYYCTDDKRVYVATGTSAGQFAGLDDPTKGPTDNNY